MILVRRRLKGEFLHSRGRGRVMQHSSKHQHANLRKRAVVVVGLSPFSFIYFVFYFRGGAKLCKPQKFTYEGSGQ